MRRGLDFWRGKISFIYYDSSSHKIGKLLAYPRYLWFNMISGKPTIYYDKLFTKAYQPYSLRNNVLICLAILLAFKINIAGQRRHGLDQVHECKCPWYSTAK